jgi:hypothetical protein
MHSVIMYAAAMYCWLSDSGYEIYIFILLTYHPDTLYLRQQGFEDPCEANSGPRANIWETLV